MDSKVSQKRCSRLIKGTNLEKPPNIDGQGFMAMLLHPISSLLVCVPLGFLANFLDWGAVPTFWLNFVGLVPLAKILGDATEELAAGLKNDMLAGLLNATFGNAVEVVIMLMTLQAGLIDVVKATLLGSVLSNLLLVLGCSFFFGGFSLAPVKPVQDIRQSQQNPRGSNLMSRQSFGLASRQSSADQDGRSNRTSSTAGSTMAFVGEKVQTFSVMSAMVNTSMLLLSSLSLCLVTVFYSQTNTNISAKIRGGESTTDVNNAAVLEVSRICAIVLMMSYGAYIFFQLVTHRGAMAEEEGEGDEEEEQPALSLRAAIGIMLATTVIVSFASEMLVTSLEEVVETLGISSHFIGIILLPIVGNACEHASAIRFAIQDKPGLSIGIAVGSSTQISLFVVPFSVMCGWYLDLPMDLNFGSLNTTVLILSVVVVLSIVVDGSVTWLQGYLLISAYLVIAVLYWHLPDKMREAIL